jgi:hypothetical protein
LREEKQVWKRVEGAYCKRAEWLHVMQVARRVKYRTYQDEFLRKQLERMEGEWEWGMDGRKESEVELK